MQQDPKPSTRRIFLNQASAAAVLSSVAAASSKSQKTIKPGVSARSASRVVGANDRIDVGMIGLGSMGTVHLRAFMKQTDDERFRFRSGHDERCIRSTHRTPRG